jgi:hypothetical protein
MIEPLETIARPELIAQEQRQQLAQLALERNWGLSLVLVGWLHLAIFLTCYYLTIVRDYHGSFGYLTLWLGELAAMGLIFRVCGGFFSFAFSRATDAAPRRRSNFSCGASGSPISSSLSIWAR